MRFLSPFPVNEDALPFCSTSCVLVCDCTISWIRVHSIHCSCENKYTIYTDVWGHLKMTKRVPYALGRKLKWSNKNQKMPFPEVYFTLLYLSNYADHSRKWTNVLVNFFATHNTKQMAYRWAWHQWGKADTGLLESNCFQTCCKIDLNQSETKGKQNTWQNVQL